MIPQKVFTCLFRSYIRFLPEQNYLHIATYVDEYYERINSVWLKLNIEIDK